MPRLKELISTKKAKITVVGLGYVGLPIALEFAKKKFPVFGFDTKRSRIERLKKAISYIDDISNNDIRKALKNGFSPTARADILEKTDVIIICVPTPLRKRKIPNISYIIKATQAIAKYLRSGQLVVLESTTYPGTTRDVMLPILERGGLKEGKDFFLAFSPERIDPGNKRYTFAKIPKIAGGISKKSGTLTRDLYSKVIDKAILVSSAETAEVIKLLENTFRIINIGLINEFTVLCNKLKIDVWEVIEGAGSKPFGFMPFYPGPGLGGHCIPQDPLYLSWKARKVGFKTKMIDLAAKVNLYMPHYVAERAKVLLNKAISKARILILGVTYKEDVKDLRESPALDIIEILQKDKARVDYADPHVSYLKIGNIDIKPIKLTARNIRKYDIVVLATGHSRFDYRMIAKNSKKILDTRNAFAVRNIRAENIIKL